MINYRFLVFAVCLSFFLVIRENNAATRSYYKLQSKKKTYKSTRKIKSVPKIRVKLAKYLEKVRVTGTDIVRENYLTKSIKFFRGRKKVNYNCLNYFKGKKGLRPKLLASLDSKTGLITFDGKKYLGNIIITTSKDGKHCDVINEVSLDKYISSLLPKEMNGSWPVEALKAQAVAARSYALHKMSFKSEFSERDFYDLENSEKHQVNGSFFDLTENSIKASKKTKGLILKTKNNKFTPIFFHAKCGGRTFLPNRIWDNEVEGYESIKCNFCKNHGKKRGWGHSLKRKRLNKFFKWLGKEKYVGDLNFTDLKAEKIMMAPDRKKNLNLRFYINEKVYIISKVLFRRYFGRVLFPSNNYKVSFKNNKLDFTGTGNGHGVGMCQLGVLDMAQKGWNYKKILSYYFPNHKLVKIY